MQPLYIKDLSAFLARFGNFVDGELRHIEIVSPTTFEITLAGQDANRGHDWITVKFELSEVSEAALLENSDYSYVDMSDGIDIEVVDYEFTLSIKNSTFFVASAALKYEEGKF